MKTLMVTSPPPCEKSLSMSTTPIRGNAPELAGVWATRNQTYLILKKPESDHSIAVLCKTISTKHNVGIGTGLVSCCVGISNFILRR